MGIATGGLTTWFSGKSAPEDQQGPQPALLFALGFAVYSPLGLGILTGCYIAFNYYRVSHKMIAGLAAGYTLLLLLFGSIFSSTGAMLASYHRPFRDLAAATLDRAPTQWMANHWGDWLVAQLPLSIAYGLCIGALVTTWKWIRRPVWEDRDRVPGPIHRHRRRKMIRAIAADLDGPTDGATLGVDAYGNRVVQTTAEAAPHTLMAGGSGAGKTTTMMIGMRDAIRRGEGVCVVDLKGAADLPAQLAEWANRYGRRFLHWSITDHRVGYAGPADGPAFYDPIGRGDPSRKKDLLIGSEKWDVEYYKSVNENYLQIAFQIADLVPNPQVDAFTDLAALLDVEKLKKRAAALFIATPKTPEGQQHAAAHRLSSNWSEMTHTVLDPYVAGVLDAAADMVIKPIESEMSAIRNMAARVQKMRQSTAGHWLKRDPENGRDIDLRRAADEGWVVVFTLDSAKYAATSAQIGGLIIQDLNTLSSDLRSNPAVNPFRVYVDEFSAVGSDNILGLLARARDAKMPCMLSTQALGDIRRIDEAFLDQVLGIVNTFILHRTNHEEDAEIFAGLTGKTLRYIKRYGVEMTSGLPGGIATGSATGQGHVEQREEHVVPASAFQALEVGHLVYITKSPKARVIHDVEVVREDEALVAQAAAFGPAPASVPSSRTVTVDHESPFTTPDDTAGDEFPSPWPVMADPAPPQAPATDEAPMVDRHVPIPLHEVTTHTPDPEPATTLVPEIDFSEPIRNPERATTPGNVDLDPADYFDDLPAIPVIPLGDAPSPEPSARGEGAVVLAADTPPQPTPTVPPTPGTPEVSVFGGDGDIDWEIPGSDWGSGADAREPLPLARPALGLPVRPPTSGNRPEVPTTQEQHPAPPMYDESEWKTS